MTELSNLGFGRVNAVIQASVVDVVVGTALGSIVNFFVPAYSKDSSLLSNSVQILLTVILTLLVIAELTTFFGSTYQNEPVAGLSLVFFSMIVQSELMKKIKSVCEEGINFISTELGIKGNMPGPFIVVEMQEMKKNES